MARPHFSTGHYYFQGLTMTLILITSLVFHLRACSFARLGVHSMLYTQVLSASNAPVKCMLYMLHVHKENLCPHPSSHLCCVRVHVLPCPVFPLITTMVITMVMVFIS